MMRNTLDCKVLQAGMKPPSEFANRVLASLSLLEPIPQSIIGTSAMLIARKPVNV